MLRMGLKLKTKGARAWRGLRRFAALRPADKRLLLRTLLLVAAVRLGLTLLSYRTVRRLLFRVVVPVRAPQQGQVSEKFVNRLMWAVTTSSRAVPAASCLTQAIAAQALLARQAQPARLHIGVAKSEQGQFQAHAWVECGGRTVIGGSDSEIARYTPIAAFDAL